MYNDGHTQVQQISGRCHSTLWHDFCLISEVLIGCKTDVALLGSLELYVLVKRMKKCRKYWYPVEYFSKQSEDRFVDSATAISVSCILVHPKFMHQDYGRLLINISYHLSKLLKFHITLERPFCYDGVSAYRSYWADMICADMERSNGESSPNVSTKAPGWS
uniref:Histone acetyltransferase n=1 Tax=Trichuris muris TaxID=70415 RepID=A0A5S6QA66_TRIMR